MVFKVGETVTKWEKDGWNGQQAKPGFIVAKVGKVRVSLNDGSAWTTSGYKWGSSGYHRDSIAKPDAKREAETNRKYMRARIQSRLQNVKYEDVTDENILKVYAILFPKANPATTGAE